MDKRLDECLRNRFERKYVLPFFWQHGSCRDKLLAELDAIHACGIREFCGRAVSTRTSAAMVGGQISASS